MKKLKLIIYLFLFTQLIFAQQTYKVTEGELQIIVPNEGIIIKKQSEFFVFKKKFNFELDNEDKTSVYKFELEKISNLQFEEYKKYKTVILVDDIARLDLKFIKKNKFVDTTNYDNKELYYYNKDVFVFRKIEKQYKVKDQKDILPYIVLNFKDNKQVIYFDDGLIIPTTSKIQIHIENKLYNYEIEKVGKRTANEISFDYLSDIHRYYEIDTIKKTKKVFLKSMFFKNVLKKTYDSIYTNRNFIVGYDKKKIDIYNYQFQKLPLNNIKAIHLPEYFANGQIISNNSLININVLGKEYKKGDGPGSIDLSYQFPDNDISFKITKEDNNYYFTGDQRILTTGHLFYNEQKIKLFNTTNIDSLEFASEYKENYNRITLSTESGYSKKYPILIYSTLKNKKFNLNTFDYFLIENLNIEQKKTNDELPKNLDFLERIDSDIYLIKKNGLCTYYPIIKDIKFKTIKKFEGNFARFQLPNGRKGWLSKNGTEYLDD